MGQSHCFSCFILSLACQLSWDKRCFELENNAEFHLLACLSEVISKLCGNKLFLGNTERIKENYTHTHTLLCHQEPRCTLLTTAETEQKIRWRSQILSSPQKHDTHFSLFHHFWWQAARFQDIRHIQDGPQQRGTIPFLTHCTIHWFSFFSVFSSRINSAIGSIAYKALQGAGTLIFDSFRQETLKLS